MLTVPGGPRPRAVRRAFALKGLYEEAIRAARKAVELSPYSLDILADLACVQALAGELEDVRESCPRAAEQPWVGFYFARAFVALGEPDSAFVWLERSGWQWPNRPVRADPALDPLRTGVGDPVVRTP